MTGTITIKAIETNGSPVENASIKVYQRDPDNSKFIMGCTTDRNGKSAPLKMEAPDIEHSMHDDPKACPYSQYDVHVAKKDYDTEVIKGVQIFPNTESTLTVVMKRCHGNAPQIHSTDLGHHTLYHHESFS